MPELPEVETIKESLLVALDNAVIQSVLVRNRHLRQEIPTDFEKNICKARITRIYRLAKYALLDLDNNRSIILHFGMSGKIRFIDEKDINYEKHDHVIFKTSRGILAYNDPRRFGLVLETPTALIYSHPLFAKLGLDPFDDELSVSYLQHKLQNKNVSIKIALLDQTIICGIGNIYASEALYDARISPLRCCNDVSIEELKRLIVSIQKILRKAINAGGSTLHDYRKPDGSTGYFQLQHAVYGKEGKPCPHCICCSSDGKGILKITQGGRSTFYCPYLQK